MQRSSPSKETGTASRRRSPPLTAATAIASEVTGREVRHTMVSDDEWWDMRVATGMPTFYADMLLGTFRAARRGDFAATDPALGQLLGRPSGTMRGILAATIA